MHKFHKTYPLHCSKILSDGKILWTSFGTKLTFVIYLVPFIIIYLVLSIIIYLVSFIIYHICHILYFVYFVIIVLELKVHGYFVLVFVSKFLVSVTFTGITMLAPEIF